MNIALIAHDSKKSQLVLFVLAYKHIFDEHNLYATGTTGAQLIMEANVDVIRLKSGPLGGDQQIGSMVADDVMDLVIFFRDPLVAQPHEPDISALLRLCDVHSIPVATNIATAEMLVNSMKNGGLAWRETLKSKYEPADSAGLTGTDG